MGDITVVTVLNGCENQLMYHWGAPPCRMSNMNIWYVPSGDPTWILESANFLKQSHPQFPSDRLEAGRSHEGMARKSSYPKICGPICDHLCPVFGPNIFGLLPTAGDLFGSHLSRKSLMCRWFFYRTILNLSCLIYFSTGCPCPERRRLHSFSFRTPAMAFSIFALPWWTGGRVRNHAKAPRCPRQNTTTCVNAHGKEWDPDKILKDLIARKDKKGTCV